MKFLSSTATFALMWGVTSLMFGQEKVGQYPISGVDYSQVKLTDVFWAPRVQQMNDVTVPHILHECEVTGRIDNFKKAAGLMEGHHVGYHFDDSDVYKAIEAASSSLKNIPNEMLEAKVDSIIHYMALAQEDDGYIYTIRSAMAAGDTLRAGSKRWQLESVKSHETYCMGHLIEAGITHFKATGKKNLLDVAVKAADLICETFGPDKRTDFPGHQGIEIALVRLYDLTGDEKYLHTAEFFLDTRGPGGDKYVQAKDKIVDQKEAVGHVVRAVYMYTALTDIAALKRREDFNKFLNVIWDDIISGKMYVTGGLGAGNGYGEGFGPDYFLPNNSYCETCSSIGNIFWNYRLFRLTGDSKYYDIIERVLYNSFLSGISLSGNQYFYTNPIENNGSHRRRNWYPCSCCPPNIARLITTLSGYLYATTPNAVYVNLFAESKAVVCTNKKRVNLTQTTSYPWSGDIVLTVEPECNTLEFALKIRIPGWANNEVLPGGLYSFTSASKNKVSIKINGRSIKYSTEKGFAVLNRTWKAGDKVIIDLPFESRTVKSVPEIKFTTGKVAVTRGPLVYCIEGTDLDDKRVLDKVLVADSKIHARFVPEKLGGIVQLTANGKKVSLVNQHKNITAADLIFIPYYAWANRADDPMTIWIASNAGVAVALNNEPTVSSLGKLKASNESAKVKCLNDGIQPNTSDDITVSGFNFWPRAKNGETWVRYDFESPQQITSAGVFWSTTHGIKLPLSWYLEYQKTDGDWERVVNFVDYEIAADKLNVVNFEVVNTKSIRLVVEPDGQNGNVGLFEWTLK